MSDKKPGRTVIRKIGYKADQQGIINRYLREMGQWDSHLWKCRKYILDSVDLHKPEIVTFLGSGWLLDIPLEEIEGKCKRVNLVDIVHPSQVKHKVTSYDKVNLIESDITAGLITEIWKASKRGTDPDEIRIPIYEPQFETGMVFSVNLLTQLDSLPADFLVNKSGKTYRDLRKLRQSVQKAHLSFLRQNNSILITDYIEYINQEDKVLKKNELLFTSLPTGNRKEEWTWEFDSTGNYYTGKRVIFGVKAIDMVRR